MPRVAEDLLDYLTDAETVLPDPQDLEVVAERVAGLHGQHGGATFNLYFGDMAGQALFAVSVYLEQSAVFLGRSLSTADIRHLTTVHFSIASPPRLDL